MKMVKVGEIEQVETYKVKNEEGNFVRREVKVKSPLYINTDNIVWIESSQNLGSTIFFNTSRGSGGVACIIVHDVLVEDMLEIIKGQTTYENVRIEDFETRCNVMKSREQTKVLKETPIPVMN